MRLQEAAQQLELALALLIRVRVIVTGVGRWLGNNGKQPIVTESVDNALALLMTTIDVRRQDIRVAMQRGGTVHDLQL